MILDFKQPPSTGLYRAVQAGFVANSTTLGKWCVTNNTSASYMTQVLMGAVNGKKSIAIRKKVIADVQKLSKGA